MAKSFIPSKLSALCLLICVFISGCASIDTSGATIDDIRRLSDATDTKWPIVYSRDYNISFAGLEKLHPFDTHKYGRVFKGLEDAGLVTKNMVYEPPRPAQTVLSRHHSEEYLENLKSSKAISEFTEISIVKWLPNSIAYNAVMEPAKRAASGSILAGELALDYGWAINLGGGYHHASKHYYGGFCAIADIGLSILHLQDNHPKIKNVMIIDLYAHQGNGHERDFAQDENVFILDMYNAEIYPGDQAAKMGIDLDVPLTSFTTDEVYLSTLRESLEDAFEQFSPDVIYYVAGTDLAEGDRLGKLSISKDGILKRDKLVFTYADRYEIPIIMLLGGGYQKNNADIISSSIVDIVKTFELTPTRRNNAP